MQLPNREAWAPPRVRAFLGLQFGGMLSLTLSTNVSSPLGLTVTIVLGFTLILAAIILAVAYSWRAGAEVGRQEPPQQSG